MNKKEIIQEIYDAINKIPRYQCNSDMGHEFIDTCHIHRLFQKLRAEVEEPRCHLNCDPCLDANCAFCRTRGSVVEEPAIAGECCFNCMAPPYPGCFRPNDPKSNFPSCPCHRSQAEKGCTDCEQLRVQLAGCSVAALGWSKGEQMAERGDYGWSASFQDVLELRRKYEALLAPKELPVPELLKLNQPIEDEVRIKINEILAYLKQKGI